MLTTFEQALEYAGSGFAVFPLHSVHNGLCTCNDNLCKSPGKHPRVINGVHDATLDVDAITKWEVAGLWNDSNIGIACGEVSNLLVVDIDPKDGGDDSFSDMLIGYEVPDTAQVLTGSGGSHLYFTYDSEVQGGAVKEGTHRLGIDIQSDGRYVVAPNSRHFTGSYYMWLDVDTSDEVRSVMTPIPLHLKTRLSLKRAVSLSHDESLGESTITALEDLSNALSCIDADDRDNWVLVGQCLHSTRDPKAFDIWSEWSSTSDKWDDRDGWRVWQSFRSGGGRTLSTIFYLAKQGGYVFQAPPSAPLLPDDPDFERAVARALEDLADVLPHVNERRERKRFFGTDAGAIMKTEFPETPWLIDSVLPDNSFMVLSGEPKTGKTWVSLEFALSVVSQRACFGYFDTCHPEAEVCMFLNETIEREFQDRVKCLGWRPGLDRIHVEMLNSMDLADVQQVAELVASVRLAAPKCRLLVLDPLREFHRQDENDGTARSGVTSNLKAMRTVLGCTVLVLHHSKKPQKGFSGRPGASMRGSSVLHGAVDGGVYLEAKGHLEAKAHVELRRGPGAVLDLKCQPSEPNPWRCKQLA